MDLIPESLKATLHEAGVEISDDLAVDAAHNMLIALSRRESFLLDALPELRHAAVSIAKSMRLAHLAD